MRVRWGSDWDDDLAGGPAYAAQAPDLAGLSKQVKLAFEHFNHRTGKAEKCTLCYPRIESGQPTICSETCVGRLRYLGLVLYAPRPPRRTGAPAAGAARGPVSCADVVEAVCAQLPSLRRPDQALVRRWLKIGVPY
jgi:4Fe-4S dicluster protein